MKKIFVQMFVAVLAVTMMASCNNDKKEVKETAESFLKALVAGDFETTRTMTTTETQAKWGDFAQYALEGLSQEAKDAIASSQISISEVKVEKDAAEAVCTATIPYLIQETSILHLVKVDGKWLINEPDAIVVNRVRQDVVALDVTNVEGSATPAAADSTVKK